MDNQISRLGQRVSSGTVGETNIHVHPKRIHEQVRQAGMFEGDTIALRIKVRTKNLAPASAQSAVETWVLRMSL